MDSEMAARQWAIHVKTLAGEELTTLQLQQDIFQTPVAELVQAACEKIGLPNHSEEFSFATPNSKHTLRSKIKGKVKTASMDQSKLLNPKKTLKKQGINEAEALTLTLRKRLFFTETTSCDSGSRHKKELDLTYLELRNATVTRVYSCTMSCDKAIKLAALQCCILCQDENVDIDEGFLDHKLSNLLPPKYAKVRGITSTILEAYNDLDQGLREDGAKAKSEYVRLCTTFDGYGITFFSGKEEFRRYSQPKLVKCYLGITRNSVWRVEANSCEVLEKWPIVNIRGWKSTRSNRLLTLILSNKKSYSFWSGDAECGVIEQLLDDYTAIGSRYSRSQSERDSNLPVRSGEGLTVDPDGPLPGNPSPNCSPRTPASATRSASGDSATAVDPSSEIPSSSSQGGNRPGEADIPIISIAGGDSAMDTSTGNPHTDSEGGNRPGETGTPIISSAGGDSADSVSPINSGEKDCPVSKARNTLDARRATGDSSEEESPIRNIRDHLTLTRLRTVRNRVWEARSKWKDIGIELKLEQTDLDAVSSKNGSDADACFGDMLSKWLKQTRSRPTWLKMIRALKRPAVGFQELAEQIESEMNSVPKQRVELLQFPHNMIEPDEESREELQGRLRENTRDIVREFNILRHKLFDMLDQGHYSVPKLAGYLKDYDADKLTTLDEVQAFIESNSSFYDYEIVKYIIQLAGSERDEERLLDYEKHFEIYAQCRVYKIQSPATSPSNPGSQSSKLRIMLDSEYDKLQCNPNKLKQFQYRICNLLKIPMGMLVFIDPKVVA